MNDVEGDANIFVQNVASSNRFTTINNEHEI